MSDSIKIGGVALTTTAGELEAIFSDLQAKIDGLEIEPLAQLVCALSGESQRANAAAVTGILVGAELYRRRADSENERLREALQAIEDEGLLYPWVNEKGISKAEWDRRSKVISDLQSALAEKGGEG